MTEWQQRSGPGGTERVSADGRIEVTVCVDYSDSRHAINIATRIVEVVTAIRRPSVLANWSADELLPLLSNITAVRSGIEWAQEVAILYARDAGASWGRLANVCGVSRSTMVERYARLVERYEWTPRNGAESADVNP